MKMILGMIWLRIFQMATSTGSKPLERYGFTKHADTATTEHFVYNVSEIFEPQFMKLPLINMLQNGKLPLIHID